MQKTRINRGNNTSFLAIILLIITLVLVLFGGIYSCKKIIDTPLTETGFFQTNAFKGLVIFDILLILIFFMINITSQIIGNISAKLKINKENKLINKTNPYIYFRTLPNNYGVGLASVMLNSQIENEKDIIACILDLCAKGYLHLDKINNRYKVKLLKNIDDNLLDNEKYIINSILNNSIKDLNYRSWFASCLKDGFALGLFIPNNQLKQTTDINDAQKANEKYGKRYLKTICIIAILFITIAIINSLHKGFITLFNNLAVSFLWIIIVSGILYLPMYYLTSLISAFKYHAKYTYESNYNAVLKDNLLLTQKGKEELSKLLAFKNFIKDFGHFADKKEEEIVLWEYYLSYAQVFNLADTILKTGYKNLIKNSAFNITNLDGIRLTNIYLTSDN